MKNPTIITVKSKEKALLIHGASALAMLLIITGAMPFKIKAEPQETINIHLFKPNTLNHENY